MKHSFDINCNDLSVQIKEKIIEKNLLEYVFIFKKKCEEDLLESISISWLNDIRNVVGSWSPGSQLKKNHRHEYESPLKSCNSSLMPLIQYYTRNQLNGITIALSELIEPIEMDVQLDEKTGGILATVRLDNYEFYDGFYRLIIRIDTREKLFYESIQQASEWFNLFKDVDLMPPDAAYEPVYSTWYSFHQELSNSKIEKQSELAKEFLLNTVIVDDGWQTDDNSRSYKFTGDWNVHNGKIAHMKEHVAKVHQYGVNYLLWVSVPYIGRNSLMWETFSDKVLYYQDNHEAYILDLRYKEVRKYLLEKYRNLMMKYSLDGLKLDFIDRYTSVSYPYTDEMDYRSIHKAVNAFLKEVRDTILFVNPNALIEFRQSYIGPTMRSMANIFRVHDCANDSIMNRVSIVDLRLTSQKTAVHSDMVTWHIDDSVENAALQIINILHSVPQISVRLDEIKPDHKKMLKYYIGLWHKYKHVFLGDMIPYSPDLNYPRIDMIHGKQKISIISESGIVQMEDKYNEYLLINGSMQEDCIVRCQNQLWVKVEYYSVTGELLSHDLIYGKDLFLLKMPISGVARITKISK